MLKTVFLLLLSFNVMAEKVDKSIVCPAITSEAATIISSIQGLKNQLKSLEGCDDISKDLAVASTIMTGKEWVNIKATLDSGESFEVDQLKKISELTQNASFALNSVVEKVTTNSQCVDDKNQASFMAKLSGVVKEVSTIVGSVAGPYGMAVSLGGTLVSSAITGIDKFYKSRHPYNFSNLDDELLFMNQFCAYAEIKKDMNDYLELENRPAELKSLDKYLDIKQLDLENNCPECKAQVISSKTLDKADLILNKIREDAKIIEQGKDQENFDYSRCTGIYQAIYSTNSDLNQYFKLLANYKNPMSSESDINLREEMVGAAKILPTRFPKLAECWGLPLAGKQEISHIYNNFLRDDILPSGNIFFGQEATSFKIRANKKYKNPLGDYTERTLLRRKWIIEEAKRVEVKLNHANYESSSLTINKNMESLKNRIFDDLFVDYLRFLMKRNLKQVSQFKNSYQKFVKQSVKKYSKILGKSVTSVDEILNELEKRPTLDKRPFLSLIKDQKTGLDIAITQSKTLDRYCHFMNYMLITTKEAEPMCLQSKIELQQSYETLSKLDDLIKSYISKKLTWLVMDRENYQSSRVKDFSDHLQRWLAEGDTRWELKPIPEER